MKLLVSTRGPCWAVAGQDRHFASQPHGVELNHPCGLTVDGTSPSASMCPSPSRVRLRQRTAPSRSEDALIRGGHPGTRCMTRLTVTGNECRRRVSLRNMMTANTTDACETRDPCQHGGICISTDSGPICECRSGDYEGAYCEKERFRYCGEVCGLGLTLTKILRSVNDSATRYCLGYACITLTRSSISWRFGECPDEPGDLQVTLTWISQSITYLSDNPKVGTMEDHVIIHESSIDVR
ncbi:hypothetical protein WN48_07413 [Eufriesea mexicana]|uniref:EGF-like domain-containing protein n=1 Tax=Eufriesea mexicana TaxID=516756 RepID=A0A310SXN0_9HYME|nr:hypothetical protein WN48_07413 [Eufriesea mexicana]